MEHRHADNGYLAGISSWKFLVVCAASTIGGLLGGAIAGLLLLACADLWFQVHLSDEANALIFLVALAIGAVLPPILLTRARRSKPTMNPSTPLEPNFEALLSESQARSAVSVRQEELAVPDHRGAPDALGTPRSAMAWDKQTKSKWGFVVIGISSAAAIIAMLATAGSLLVGSTLDLEIKAENSH